MKIETTEEGPDSLRLTLDAREVHLLKAALTRAAYVDIDPQDVEPALGFAEELLETLSRIQEG
jgi:hypothetical protein